MFLSLSPLFRAASEPRASEDRAADRSPAPSGDCEPVCFGWPDDALPDSDCALSGAWFSGWARCVDASGADAEALPDTVPGCFVVACFERSGESVTGLVFFEDWVPLDCFLSSALADEDRSALLLSRLSWLIS